MKISTLLYTIRQGFANIFRNKWYSLASTATIAACLFLFGLFYAILANFEHVIRSAEEGVSVTVFFEQGTSEERIKEIGDMISKRDEVAEIHFQSADDIWATFGPEYFGEDYAEGFPDNPLEGEDNYEIFLTDVALQDGLVTWLSLSLQWTQRISRCGFDLHFALHVTISRAFLLLGKSVHRFLPISLLNFCIFLIG